MNTIFSKSPSPKTSAALLFLLCLLLGCSLQAQQQVSYRSFEQTLPTIDSTIVFAHYDKVFVVHFQFCTGSKYCRENLVSLIGKQKGNRILVICENAGAKILQPLTNQSRFEFKEINTITLTQYGLFSVYNIMLNPKKKKLKKLQ